MASSSINILIFFVLLVSLSSLAASGGITCESLDQASCAFAVSSAGMRCVLEKHGRKEGYTCRTSAIEAAEGRKGWIETDRCIEACGLDRSSLGISSDSLLEPRFTQKLCSAQCYHGCPNVVDLYFNLAAGEGVFLPKLCEAQQVSARRSLVEIRSSPASASFVVASGPATVSSEKLEAIAPVQSLVVAEGPITVYSEKLEAIAPVQSPEVGAISPAEAPVVA